jgi:hypothetical protein
VNQGVDELDTEKLSPLLKLRYHNAIADAVKDLGSRGANQAGVCRLSKVFVPALKRLAGWRLLLF